MIKIFIFLIFYISVLFAGNIEIFGEKSSSTKHTVVVYNGMLIKKDLTLSAQKIVYNPDTNFLYASGNVYINFDNSYILANKVKLNVKNNDLEAKPFFLFNFEDEDWINAISSKKINNKYISKKSIASTCNVNHPDWKIIATSVEYNKDNKWIDLYNPTLYLKDLPIIYMPYLGFSLSKERRSGFLRPIFGYSAYEGFLLTIPYYQVLGDMADLEIDPTIRTRRGKGIYSTLRFVHSPTSYGEFKIGKFIDKNKFQKKYNLMYKKHRGWNFLYKNYDFFGDDKLYMDLKYATDTQYFDLDSYNTQFKTTNNKVLISKINYYIKNNNNFLGVYNKYFEDTSKTSNKDTMQILPQINYHKFNYNFYNNFSYSVDANIYNYTRKEGYTAIKQSLLLPINYNINFLNDYIKFDITEEFATTRLTTNDDNVSKYSVSNTIIKLYSNLSKRYKNNFSHHIAPSISFNMNNRFYFNENDNEYVDKSKLQKSLTFKFRQYLIAKDWQINHQVSQTYYLENNTTNYSNILNDISLSYLNFYVSDNTRYVPSTNDITYNVFTIGYKNSNYKLETRYLYRHNDSDITKNLNLNSFFKFDKFHKIFGEYNYDLENNQEKYYLVGIDMRKKCWNYSISYKQEITPLLTNDGVSNLVQKTLYFQIELVPLGGFQQQYKFKTKGAQ